MPTNHKPATPLPWLDNAKENEMVKPYVWTPNPERDALVSEYNALRRESALLQAKLEKMEAHEGDDGRPEDVEGQLKLQDEIRVKDLRISAIRKIIYPTSR